MKEQPKRLGRGLAALLGDAAVPVSVSAPGVQSLGVDALEPSPFQARMMVDEAALSELAASITQRGILQPLLVRPHPSRPGIFQIIAGERRWRAAQKAQLHEVPVLVRELSDIDAMAAGLVENLQRTDLNPVEEALGYQRLLKEFRMTQEVLADAIGKSRVHITQSLRMLTLPARVLELVVAGRLSSGHARSLVNSNNPEAMARRVIKDNLTVRQTEELVNKGARDLAGDDPAVARGFIASDLDTVGLSLSEKLGCSVKLSFNGKSGTVVLSYRSLDQLDEILALLNR
jgi:ParB family chromosome partitioning protein